MPGVQDQGSVKTLSHTSIGEDSETASTSHGGGLEDDLSDRNPFKGDVDFPSAITVAEEREKFDTQSPNSSPQRSDTPPHSSASSNQSAPIPAPRSISLQNAGGEDSFSSANESFTYNDSRSTDGSETHLLQGDKSNTANKITSRFLPRVNYAMQQKSFVIPATSFFLITTYLSSQYLYRLLYLKETISFVNYIQAPQIWPLLAISSVLAVTGLCAFIHNYRNTESPDIKNFNNLISVISSDNLVHDITVYKKNNDQLKFKNKSYAGHREIPNFTYKTLKLVKERALFNVCLSSLITIGSIYPLTKYLELGSEGFIKFFSNFSSGKEELMFSKLFVSENSAKLLGYLNSHNLELIAFAAVLTVLVVSLITISAYYRNEKTKIEPLKFDILVSDDVEKRNSRYLAAVEDKCSKITTEIGTVVIRHYKDVEEENKVTVLAL